jgi:hypothetical protein
MRAMDAREVGYRGVQYLRARAKRAGLGLAKPVPAGAARGSPWIQPLPKGFILDTYRQSADAVLGGRFRLFGNREWALGFPPAWNRDPSSGVRAPLEFGMTLDYRDAATVGNIKYLWEPNRHLELVTLAQAWHLTGEQRFAQGCGTLLDSWFEQCPYMLGPNWTSSLELALRLLNWSCAWHLLGGDGSVLFAGEDGAALRARWLNAVRQHCHFIAGHLSRYSSANNHLLGELLGLLVGATTWPCWPESDRWLAQAGKRFEEQALQQNGADGVNKEQATWYHHEVADMLLLAGLTARANGRDFSRAYWDRLEAMIDFICSCMDVGGNVPAFGDSDDAVMVRFSPQPDFRVYHSLLATGSVLFGRGDFKHKAQSFDDKSRWLLGDAAAAAFAALTPDRSGRRVRRAFTCGGYYILGSDFEAADEVRMVADAAPLGYLSIAAHGHADALSFTLSVSGHPMLIDPGTYCYHTERRWRDYFRGTSAHNTVRIDREDQSVAGGTFLWNHHAEVRCVAFETGSDYQRLVAQHDGYRRLPHPVVHRREIVYRPATRVVEVTDRLAGVGRHYVETFWHFARECVVTLDEQEARVVRPGVEIVLRWPQPLQAQVVRGRAEPCLGWVSQRFDEKVPAAALVACGEVGADWQGVSTLTIYLRPS